MPTATVASALMLTTRTLAFLAAKRPRRADAICQKPTNWSGCFSSFLVSFLVATGLGNPPRVPEITDRSPLVKCGRGPALLVYSAGVRHRAVVLALAVSLAAGRTAAAAGEHEWQAALRLGAGTVSVDGRKPWGLAGGVDLEYGLTDAWALRLSFEGSTHDVSKSNDMDTRPAGAIRTDAALIGLTYTFDVLRLVPYADVQVGLRAGPRRRGRAAVAAGHGAGRRRRLLRHAARDRRDQLSLPVRAGRPAVRPAEPRDESRSRSPRPRALRIFFKGGPLGVAWLGKRLRRLCVPPSPAARRGKAALPAAQRDRARFVLGVAARKHARRARACPRSRRPSGTGSPGSAGKSGRCRRRGSC